MTDMDKFESYCYKERMKQLKYNTPFLIIFGVRLSLFFTNIILGFDVIAFDKWIKPKDNQSTYESAFERYGQDGVELLKRLVD